MILAGQIEPSPAETRYAVAALYLIHVHKANIYENTDVSVGISTITHTELPQRVPELHVFESRSASIGQLYSRYNSCHSMAAHF